jgi:outer membrane receptor protein involved in Fe transport
MQFGVSRDRPLTLFEGRAWVRAGIAVIGVLLFLALGGEGAVLAQKQGTVTGRVVDEAGRPLPGASVRLEGEGRGDATSNDGRYSIDAPPGTYTLQASFVGYTPRAREVTLQAGKAVTVNFTLTQDLLEMSEAVKTASFNPFAKLESSVAISTISAQDIQTESPQSTADLLKAVPGFYVESSGGEGENNLFARGLPADGSYRYVSLQEDGTQIYQASELDFASADNFVRVDATLARIEAVRGGSASTFASNSPGGIVNLVSKTGGNAWSGQIKLTGQHHGQLRGDVNVGGPLSESWRVNVGGFYRQGPGLRDPGFTGNRGGQVKANLTWQTESGRVRIFGKYLNDRTIFYLPVPYKNPGAPQSIAGFDLETGTLTTDDAETVTVPNPQGNDVTRDLTDGIHPIVKTGGAELLFDLGGGWSLKNTARVTDIDHTFSAVLSLNNPVDAQSYADSLVANTPGATGYQYERTNGGSFDPATANGNGLVVETGWWYNEKPMSHVHNDLQITKELPNHSITANFSVSRFTTEDFRHWNDLLTEVDERPDRLDLTLVDDAGNTVAEATNRGFRRYGSNYLTHEATGWMGALHVGDRWDVTDALYVEMDGRVQRSTFSGTLNGGTATNLDGDPATLYDNNFRGSGGSATDYDYTFDEWAVSVGLNYRFNDNLAVFARGSRGFRMPNFDQWIASGTDDEPGIERGAAENIIQSELGIKFSSSRLALFASGFYTRLSDILFSDQVVDPVTGDTRTILNTGDSRAIGTELELILQPSDRFQLSTRTTIQNPVFTNLQFDTGQSVLDFEGNRVKRIPLVMLTMKPSYSLGALTLYGKWSYFGDRFANNRNSFTLPEYNIVDVGVSYTWGGVILRADATNLFNTVGLTEGNPRVDETFSEEEVDDIEVFMGRPVLPRALKLSVTYSF